MEFRFDRIAGTYMALTLAGTKDDGSDRSAVNRFFLNLSAENRSVAIKPLAEFMTKIKPFSAHPVSRPQRNVRLWH